MKLFVSQIKALVATTLLLSSTVLFVSGHPLSHTTISPNSHLAPRSQIGDLFNKIISWIVSSISKKIPSKRSSYSQYDSRGEGNGHGYTKVLVPRCDLTGGNGGASNGYSGNVGKSTVNTNTTASSNSTSTGNSTGSASPAVNSTAATTGCKLTDVDIPASLNNYTGVIISVPASNSDSDAPPVIKLSLDFDHQAQSAVADILPAIVSVLEGVDVATIPTSSAAAAMNSTASTSAAVVTNPATATSSSSSLSLSSSAYGSQSYGNQSSATQSMHARRYEPSNAAEILSEALAALSSHSPSLAPSPTTLPTPTALPTLQTLPPEWAQFISVLELVGNAEKTAAVAAAAKTSGTTATTGPVVAPPHHPPMTTMHAATPVHEPAHEPAVTQTEVSTTTREGGFSMTVAI